MVSMLRFSVSDGIYEYVDELLLRGLFSSREDFFRRVIGAVSLFLEGIFLDKNCFKAFVKKALNSVYSLLRSRGIDLDNGAKRMRVLRIPDAIYDISKRAVSMGVFSDVSSYVEFVVKIYIYFNTVCEFGSMKYSYLVKLFEAFIDCSNMIDALGMFKRRMRDFFTKRNLKILVKQDGGRYRDISLEGNGIINRLVELGVFRDAVDLASFIDSLCLFMKWYEPEMRIRQEGENVFQLDYEP